MRSLIEAGAFLVCGSDWPNGGELITLRPLDAIQIGLSRLGLDGGAEILGAEERVNLLSLLESYTCHAAYADFAETISGSIEPGKRADLIVIDQNIFAIPVSEIHNAQVELTLFDGRVVYRKG